MAIDPFSIGIGAVTALPRIGTGIGQLISAGDVKLQDTTAPEQREAWALARQRAAAGRLPGQGMLRNRLAQGQAAAIQAARLGASTPTELLASTVAADRVRTAGEMQLGLQAEQYNERAQQGLGIALREAAAQRKADLNAYNTQKAALIEGGVRNITSGIDTGAAYVANQVNADRDREARKNAASVRLPLGADAGEAERNPTFVGPVDSPPDLLAPVVPNAFRADVLRGKIGAVAPPEYVNLRATTPAPGIRGTAYPGYRPSLTGGRYRTSGTRYGYPITPAIMPVAANFNDY